MHLLGWWCAPVKWRVRLRAYLTRHKSTMSAASWPSEAYRVPESSALSKPLDL